MTTVPSSPEPLQVLFPTQLHYIISKLESDDQHHIASWKPHGRCFAVHNRHEFIDKVLALYVYLFSFPAEIVDCSHSWLFPVHQNRWLRMTKFQSFQRQLNIYGFTRIPSGPDKDCYYHDAFLRGEPALAAGIKRMPVKGTGPRRPNAVMEVPNFYKMTFLTANHGNAESHTLATAASVEPASTTALTTSAFAKLRETTSVVGNSSAAATNLSFLLQSMMSERQAEADNKLRLLNKLIQLLAGQQENHNALMHTKVQVHHFLEVYAKQRRDERDALQWLLALRGDNDTQLAALL